ncbi:MAG: EF-hand domain-containing protein [Solimonas sp.]
MRLILLSLLLASLALAASCASDPQPTINQQIRDAFKAADKDGDEQLSPAEFADLPLKGVKFEEVDTDGNGKVSLAELQSYLVWRRVQAEGNRPFDSSMPRRRY